MTRESLQLISVQEDNKVDSNQFVQCHEARYEEDEPSCLEKASQWVINFLETTFYKLGGLVAHHPVLTIVLCLLVCGGCGVGLLKLELTDDDSQLWVPRDAQLLPQKAWVETTFPERTRFVSVIVTSANIISPWILNAVYELYAESQRIQTSNNKTLQDLCVRVGPTCYVKSILELWSYDEGAIRHMSLQNILDKVNADIKYSPLYGTEMNLEYMLSGIQRDYKGDIIGAKALTIQWVLKNDPQLEAAAMEWEKKMIAASDLKRDFLIKTYVYATRSFDDEGYGAVSADTTLLTAGFITVFVFIILVLGRFNMVENKVYVSLCGILTIGLAILFSYGLAIACGLMYGPIHAMMPFLLLGIGVDDMFVIVSAWDNLQQDQKKLPLEEKIALSLKNAGVSITVTSITDVVAFGIGGSTVIPALSTFCGYAALGILGLYVLVSTFFVAVLTLDQRRIAENRNSIFFCYIHKNYTPNKFSQINLVSTFMEKFYAPLLMKRWCKIAVLSVTLVLASVNLWSFTMLRQDFNLYDYLPTESYATDYINALQRYYPDKGYEAAVYCDSLDYYGNRFKFERLAWDMNHSPYIQNGSVHFWYSAFMKYVETTNDTLVASHRRHKGYPLSRQSFQMLLPYFLQQREGRAFGPYLKFLNSTPPKLMASKVPLIHTRQVSAAGDIDAMENLRTIIENIGFTDGVCFCYGIKYINNEANKVLQSELYRNLALAAVCVFLVTLVLIANLWTSLLVFSCVAFTVIDVTGSLQFWGVSVDIASSILIILSVGLAVDYSAHVGHTFMTMTGRRETRAKATIVNIGPAVLNGGFSTFLAFVLLVDSKSYGFVLFFRVFVMCVVFGLFHGLVYLPVLLSWIGPSSHKSRHKLRTSNHAVLEPNHVPLHSPVQADTEHGPDNNGCLKDCFPLCLNTPRTSSGETAFLKERPHSDSTMQHENEVQFLASAQSSDVGQPECEGHHQGNSMEGGQQLPGDDVDGWRDKAQCRQCGKVCTVCVLERLHHDLHQVMSEVRGQDTARHCTCDKHKSICLCECSKEGCKCETV